MGLKDILNPLDPDDLFEKQRRPYDLPYRRTERVTRATVSLCPTLVRAESWSCIPFEPPNSIFRGDFLYLDCDGLLIEELKVGNVIQPIGRYTPARYFNEPRASAEKLAKAVELLHQTPLGAGYEEQRMLVDKLVTEALGQSAKYRGRPVELNTQEMGAMIELSVRNPTPRDIWARGTLEGKTVIYDR